MQPVVPESNRVVIYTDDALVAIGAASLLMQSGHFQVVSADQDVSRLLALVKKTAPNVLLLQLTPDFTFGLVASLRAVSPETRLVLWARTFSDEVLEQGRLAGVAGFLKRGCTTQAFVENMVKVLHGDTLFDPEAAPSLSTKVNLTQRESQLVALLAQGLRNKEISNCLGITEGTVRIYLSKLFAKVGARDRFELAVFGLKNSMCGQAHWDGPNGYVTDADEARARPVLRSLLLVEPKRRRGYAPMTLSQAR